MENLPPCIVYESGEPLDEWVARARPDLQTTLDVLCAISERVADIHSTGFVHRDLKPSNIIWRRSQAAWTITDFGCAAPMGEPPRSPRELSPGTHRMSHSRIACSCPHGLHASALVSLGSARLDRRGTCTLWHISACGKGRRRMAHGCNSAGYMTKITDSKVYIPPETLFAHSVNAHSVSVDSAADVWALGVLMLECLSGTPSAAAHAPVSTFVPGAGTATIAGGTGSIAGGTGSVISGPAEDDAARLTRALFERLESVSLPRIYGAPVTAEIANELRALRLKMAGCLAREPVRRPTVTQLVATLQKTRDALQAASAANVWMPRDSAAVPPVLTAPPAAEPAAAQEGAPEAQLPAAQPPAPAPPPPPPAPPPAAATAAAEEPAPTPASAQPPRPAAAEAPAEEPAELRGRQLTGMLDSDARVAKCEAWVARMQEVTQERPTMTVTMTEDAALDSPPRRATASMFGPSGGLPGVQGAAQEGSTAGVSSSQLRGRVGEPAARLHAGHERAPFVPPDIPMTGETDPHTREVTPLVTSPLELKADSTLDSELAGGEGR